VRTLHVGYVRTLHVGYVRTLHVGYVRTRHVGYVRTMNYSITLVPRNPERLLIVCRVIRYAVEFYRVRVMGIMSTP
jgi:hypothetical protein